MKMTMEKKQTSSNYAASSNSSNKKKASYNVNKKYREDGSMNSGPLQCK
jgi:hypothetical protein